MEEEYSRYQNPVVILVMGILRFLDLDTKEKGSMALIEVVPTVGLWYALLGRRIRINKDKTISLERINVLQRGYYLAGELLVSGHIIAGISDSIRRQGMAKVRSEFTTAIARRAQETLVRRTLEGAKKFKDSV